MKLGRVQNGVLRAIASHGWYAPGCGWAWGGADTLTVCETLVTKGLVMKVPWASQPGYRYELSKAGHNEAASRGYELLRNKLGYAMLVEKDAIRARLKAEGVTDRIELFLAVEAAYIEAHKGDSTLRERQEARRLEREAAEPKLPCLPKPILFTVDELERLAEYFSQANDPVSASIGEKAVKTLRALGRVKEPA